MDKKADIIRIWQECFPEDTPQWRRMFFDAAYSDDVALTATDPDSEQTVSSLLLLPYSMTFQGQEVDMAYIYGAGTLRKYRARGHMSRLMVEALREAADHGDMLAALVPASVSLRQYYGRFGFSTVFFRRPERYTSLHRFEVQGDYVELNASPLDLYADFDRLMSLRPCCVQHTRTQFLTLMDDARLSAHLFAAVARAGSDWAVAMVWAEPEIASDTMRVTELLAEDTDAANAALAALKRQIPDRPLTIFTPLADDEPGRPGAAAPGGMARVVRPDIALGIVAAAHPKLRLTVSLTDREIPDNSGTYTLSRGDVTFTPALSPQADLSVTPATLTSLLFGSRPISDITGLPATRPQMSLMLS